MTSAYCNMAGPPRSQLHREIRLIGRYIIFSFMRHHMYRIDLNEFARQHRAELEAVPRPTGFMVGMVSPPPFDLFKELSKFHFPICNDPILTVAILGRTSGTLYIPHREISFSYGERNPWAVSYFYFPARYFPSFPMPEDPS